MHFITRERIHVDRIATAWAVRRFIDPKATFEFVPRIKDFSSMDGIPFDIRGAELSHRHGRCILNALIAKVRTVGLGPAADGGGGQGSRGAVGRGRGQPQVRPLIAQPDRVSALRALRLKEPGGLLSWAGRQAAG